MPLNNPNTDPANLLPAIEARGHTTPEGLLNLSIPVGLADADVVVILHVKPVVPNPTWPDKEVDENGWPRGYFDVVAGSMPDLERGPQGTFENRLPLE